MKEKTFIFNPNCSELVTHLNRIGRDEILNAFSEINEHCQDWTLCMTVEIWRKVPWVNYPGQEEKKGKHWDWVKTLAFPCDDQILDRAILVAEGPDGPDIILNKQEVFTRWAERMAFRQEGLEGENFMDNWNRLTDAGREKYRAIMDSYVQKDIIAKKVGYGGFDLTPRLCMVEGHITEPTEVEGHLLGPDFHMGDGYSDDNGLTFQLTQHCCENEFPIMRQIVNIFESDVTPYDGGTDDDYQAWLEANYPDEAIHRADEYGPEDDYLDFNDNDEDGENIHLGEGSKHAHR